jgi:hypothetical protein
MVVQEKALFEQFHCHDEEKLNLPSTMNIKAITQYFKNGGSSMCQLAFFPRDYSS